jgi:hypothetical protein
MWWWILPLAPDVPERLIVGNERAFLTWFYERHATPDAIDTATVDEYLRTFSGRDGVLGALGVYRAAFATMEQTAPLTRNKVQAPLVALGGEQGSGPSDSKDGRDGRRTTWTGARSRIAVISFPRSARTRSCVTSSPC